MRRQRDLVSPDFGRRRRQGHGAGDEGQRLLVEGRDSGTPRNVFREDTATPVDRDIYDDLAVPEHEVLELRDMSLGGDDPGSARIHNLFGADAGTRQPGENP